MQIYSVVFALRRQINKQKYAKTINLLCKTNKDFVKHQSQRGGRFNTNPPPCVRPWFSQHTSSCWTLIFSRQWPFSQYATQVGA